MKCMFLNENYPSVMMKQAYFESYMKCFVGLSEFGGEIKLFGPDSCW